MGMYVRVLDNFPNTVLKSAEIFRSQAVELQYKFCMVKNVVLSFLHVCLLTQ
jgi:hypothetical protein